MAQKKRKVKRSTRTRKKPLTAEQIKRKRSIAAKRGWKTRKKKAAEFSKKLAQGKQRVIELDETNKIAVDMFEKGMIFAIRTFPLAQQRQILNDVIAEYVKAEKMEPDEETTIRQRLIIAEAEGRFDDEAQALAAEFDMDIREIYTLWISPE